MKLGGVHRGTVTPELMWLETPPPPYPPILPKASMVNKIHQTINQMIC